MTLETYRIMSGERLTDVTLDGVRLPEESLLGEWQGGGGPLWHASSTMGGPCSPAR